ncbi:TonB-dependent receptor [Mucilaginibacter sp. BJC16-A38]|uniref:TonB-dependent receptor n=1 Tax=Mucilaginibacter phenanthrenivorans TaxID=1234842 RepID=UPI0021582AEE|nr:TonB-dependent receptor [Mucilaginibacter phenanthrenivorans]MCR8561463.1 TonB-dependent receptor [Mucilaginibacter phenanthrenivorans]
MKITFSQILIALMLSGIAYSSPLKAQDVLDKTVNMSLKNTTLLDVVNYLQKNNNVKFIYSKNAINFSQRIDANFENQPLKTVLDQVFKNNGIDYEVLKDRIVLGKLPNADMAGKAEGSSPDIVAPAGKTAFSIPVSGKVLDEKGLPIPGASVLEKGTTNGITTGIDGAFKLNVKDQSAVLVIAFVGYVKQEIPVGSQTNITVNLVEDVKGINEVIVVGYGVQKKSVTTGSISSVSSKDFENQPAVNIEQILQGRTSGLTITTNDGQPGDGATVRVRGITTFNNNDPLWVVDGVVVDNGGIGYLNQSDIESIEVLKDAASSAIYGTRAAAGVILVTTKKGKAGRMQITYNGWGGTSAPARKLDLLNATQYATLRNESSVAAGKGILFADPASLGVGTDWQSVIFNNSAKEQNHELSIAGGTDKSTYYTSFGYLDQNGIVASPISKYTRANFRTNETFKPSKYLNFGINVGYTYNKSIGLGNTNSVFGGPLSSAINLDPITPVIVTDPTAAQAYAAYPNAIKNAQGYYYGISSGPSLVGQEITNPLAYIQTRLGNYSWAHNIVGNAYAEVDPIAGLAIKSTIGTKMAFYGDESFTPLSYLNASTVTSLNNYNRDATRLFNWNVENTISYTRTYKKHNLNVLLGQGSYIDGGSYSQGVTEYGLPVTTFEQASLNYSIPAVQRIGYGGEGQPHHISSLFARLNYNYDEKYIVQGVVRRDGSSRFGGNNKYGNFPSISLGWVPSKESFWPQNDVVDFLKLRGGYGVVGNDAIPDNAFLATIGGGRNYSFGTGDTYISGYSPNAPSNPDLKWEQTSQTNIGLDAVLFHDFNLTLEWFKKKTTGILQQPNLPFYIGAISNPYANIGDMENTGQELSLSYHKKVGDFNLGFDGNVSHLKNTVTRLAPGQDYLGGAGVQNVQGGVTRSEVGHPIGSFYGYENLGVFQTQSEVNAYISPKTGQRIQPNAKPGDFKWADLDGNGIISDADRTFIGNSLPTMQFGVTLTASYKQFDVLVFGQGQSGNKIFQGLHRLDILTANYTTAALGRWTGPGTSTVWPRLTDADANNNFEYNSSFFLQSGSYFRFRTIQLGYTLDKDVVKKLGIQRLRLYVTGQNLITFTKYTGYDPDISGSIDQGFYPQARTYIVGLSVGF